MGLTVVGCSSDRDRVEKQLAKLSEQVTELQAETDRMGERLDAVEASKPAPTDQRLASAAPETMSRPKLKVVRVDPEAGAEPEVSDADSEAGPRVVIQGEGKSLETRTLPGAPKAAPKVEKAEKPAKAEKAEKADPPFMKK
jgi:outer membrane murein-binding lipoprotein Lpp